MPTFYEALEIIRSQLPIASNEELRLLLDMYKEEHSDLMECLRSNRCDYCERMDDVDVLINLIEYELKRRCKASKSP